ncbi:hypothetical protein F5Y17DRAFT_477522 [Xylariaceae sp. FL0594]|nr:hypothetical protein F5Y17DRAFT_477522 [Xylariaceae sp. FL0594]
MWRFGALVNPEASWLELGELVLFHEIGGYRVGCWYNHDDYWATKFMTVCSSVEGPKDALVLDNHGRILALLAGDRAVQAYHVNWVILGHVVHFDTIRLIIEERVGGVRATLIFHRVSGLGVADRPVSTPNVQSSSKHAPMRRKETQMYIDDTNTASKSARMTLFAGAPGPEDPSRDRDRGPGFRGAPLKDRSKTGWAAAR